MPGHIHSITVDCHDHFRLAEFWKQVLDGYSDHPDDPNKPGDTQSGLVGPPGYPWIMFIPVPEDKVVKNRLHFDVRPVGRTRDDEVQRLLAVGARIVGDYREGDGTGWVTMADFEGNEFCIERSDAERSQTS
jgi:Glyoxalase-like domain